MVEYNVINAIITIAMLILTVPFIVKTPQFKFFTVAPIVLIIFGMAYMVWLFISFSPWIISVVEGSQLFQFHWLPWIKSVLGI